MHRQSTGGASIRAAFTLIELLVVIAIIAILAAILFPVFAQAKSAAKKAAAVSNNKQILLGEIMYSNDVDDQFVPYFSGYLPATSTTKATYTSPQFYWPQLISPYISKANGHGAGGQAIDTDLSGVFFDPIETIKPQTTGTANGNEVSWGISDDVVDWYDPAGVQGTFFPRNNSAAATPANTLIFTETYDWINEQGYPGSALAYSYFDITSSDYPGVPTVGALRTVDAHYRTSYTKACKRKSECTNWFADLNGLNITGFIDGHTKAIPVGTITTQGNYWSLGGNNQWP